MTMFDIDYTWVYPTNSPLSRQVVVISDSDYETYQRDRAEHEILVLENKINRYSGYVKQLEDEVLKIKEKFKLLPAPTPKNEIKELLE